MSKSDPADGHNAELAGRLARFTVAATASLVLLLLLVYPFATGAWDADVLRQVALVFMMLLGGALGGCLYNLRGIVKHMQEQDFFDHFELTYRLRPVSGALCGIFVFALVYGGVLTLSVGSDTVLIEERAAVLYLGITLLAGYGSHEFLRKVKDLNRTLFALSASEESSDKTEK